MVNFLFAFFQGVLETSGITALSLALARVPLRWGFILVFGVVSTTVITIIRALPFSFGMHTFAFLLLSLFFIYKATRVQFLVIFIVVFTGNVVLGLLEVVNTNLFSILLQKEVSDILSDKTLWKLIGIPQALLMIALAVLTAKFRKPLDSMWRI